MIDLRDDFRFLRDVWNDDLRFLRNVWDDRPESIDFVLGVVAFLMLIVAGALLCIDRDAPRVIGDGDGGNATLHFNVEP